MSPTGPADGERGAPPVQSARRSVPFMLPRHHAEIDRLDVQHYALRAGVRGNYLAPLDEAARILDLGSGTGQWAFDLCAEFPGALVVGVDLEPSKPDGPANYRFVRANLMEGVPFAGDRFDFVHQRLMMTSVPVPAWPPLVRDALRVARTGGWVELVEIGDHMEPAGPATKHLWELGNRLAASFGLDSAGTVLSLLDEFLRRAGAVGVTRREVALPVGYWGDRIGSFMASDIRALFTRLGPVMESRFQLEPGFCGELLAEALQECEEYRTEAIFTFAYGRKP